MIQMNKESLKSTLFTFVNVYAVPRDPSIIICISNTQDLITKI